VELGLLALVWGEELALVVVLEMAVGNDHKHEGMS
jgi:hypothetical protein